MKSFIIKILFVFVGLLMVFQLLQFTNFLKLYNQSTTSNEPSIALNSHMLSTNLKKAKNNDFIVYNFDDEYAGKHKRIHRLVAQEGDVLKIIHGTLFVNNINIDQDLTLSHIYRLPKEKFDSLDFTDSVLEQSRILTNRNEVLVYLDDNFVKLHNLSEYRFYDTNKKDAEIYATYNEEWTKDNFGPIVIPKGKTFVLGDNRENSHDSRYTGFIDKKEVTGVLIYK